MRTITKSQYLQLVGLLSLAKQHNAALRDIVKAACAITGEQSDGLDSHTADAIYCDEDAALLLQRLDIDNRFLHMPDPDGIAG